LGGGGLGGGCGGWGVGVGGLVCGWRWEGVWGGGVGM